MTIDASIRIAPTAARNAGHGAIEVDLSLHINGHVVGGHVSLARCADGRPGYEACGQSRDAWVSGGVLRMLERELADDTQIREALDMIEASASAYAGEALEA